MKPTIVYFFKPPTKKLRFVVSLCPAVACEYKTSAHQNRNAVLNILLRKRHSWNCLMAGSVRNYYQLYSPIIVYQEKNSKNSITGRCGWADWFLVLDLNRFKNLVFNAKIGFIGSRPAILTSTGINSSKKIFCPMCHRLYNSSLHRPCSDNN